jgi:hypothetical protein
MTRICGTAWRKQRAHHARAQIVAGGDLMDEIADVGAIQIKVRRGRWRGVGIRERQLQKDRECHQAPEREEVRAHVLGTHEFAM